MGIIILAALGVLLGLFLWNLPAGGWALLIAGGIALFLYCYAIYVWIKIADAIEGRRRAKEAREFEKGDRSEPFLEIDR